jgi:hypothetical protein
MLRCSICSFQTTNFTQLRLHIEAHRPKASKVQGKYIINEALLPEAGLEDINVNDYKVLTISGTFTVFNRLDMSKIANDFDVFYEPEVQNSATLTMDGYIKLWFIHPALSRVLVFILRASVYRLC